MTVNELERLDPTIEAPNAFQGVHVFLWCTRNGEEGEERRGQGLNHFTTKFKEYLLPTFQREMYK